MRCRYPFVTKQLMPARPRLADRLESVFFSPPDIAVMRAWPKFGLKFLETGSLMNKESVVLQYKIDRLEGNTSDHDASLSLCGSSKRRRPRLAGSGMSHSE
jgi:hypothetical protein